ncbi:MAG: glycoside hydrolase family 15 protein [Pyrinomonadaceae bacterium]
MRVSSFLHNRQVGGGFILPFYLLLFTFHSFAQTTAPGGPGQDAEWLSAAKQAIGTSANPESKVWFTLANGVLTEVLYPNVQTANVQMLQFVVVNPKTKKVETEWDDANHQIKSLRPDSLSFEQINVARSGQWTITKSYTTDPQTDSLLIDVQFRSKVPGLLLYVYYDPSIANSGLKDRGYAPAPRIVMGKDNGSSKSESLSPTSDFGLGSSEGSTNSLLLFTSPISEMTSGYVGTDDGMIQLRKFGRIRDPYWQTGEGNIGQMARIVRPARFTAILSFGTDDGYSGLNEPANTRQSQEKGFARAHAEYDKGWSDFIKTLPKVDLKYQSQFNMAAMVVKALEDKSARGGNVASLSVPWGGGGNGNTGGTGYRMVWSRDLYHVFTAFLAIGDKPAAERALDFLFQVQQQPDGSFPQNSGLNGKDGWGSLQMDEVSYPLVMAWQLSRFDKDTWGHVKKSADFIVAKGPYSPQERWEERPGYSPSTIAAEIAGLVCAAEIAKRNGDNTSAELYLQTADNWAANVEKWTATTKGKYGDGNYYLRISEKGEPDAGHKIELNNNAGTFYEHEIVDAGFLELVRFGIKRANDPLIVKSLKVVDELLKVDTPSGPAFRRYTHDGYGEMDDGRRWNWDRKYTGRGRPWPLLSGERGQYELTIHSEYIQAIRDGLRKCAAEGRLCPPPKPVNTYIAAARKRLDHMLAFASVSLMLPEQIWDKATISNTDRRFVPELKPGKGTGSATPLAWSMAAFIRLATNLKAGKNLDTPQIVYDRYVLGKK